jgi:acyl dehydratase
MPLRATGGASHRRRPALGYPRSMVRTTLSDLTTKVGSEIGVSEWFEVTQHVVDDFAGATRDVQWIHVDAERATRESPFRTQDGAGCTVAHGFLTLSMLSHWMDSTVVVTDRRAGINAGFNKVRFSGPVLVGSRSRARFTRASSDPIPGGAKLLWHVSVEREGQSRPVLTAEWLTRVLTAAVPDAAPDQRTPRSSRRRRHRQSDRETPGRSEALSSELSLLKR